MPPHKKKSYRHIILNSQHRSPAKQAHTQEAMQLLSGKAVQRQLTLP